MTKEEAIEQLIVTRDEMEVGSKYREQLDRAIEVLKGARMVKGEKNELRP